jgi:acyl-CoA reductase-like NAD-dependent aldehyde dehydrogenase
MTYQMLINGHMVDGDSMMDVINPATEEVVSPCPRASISQLEEAVAAAKAAFPAWSATPLEERRAALYAIADAIEADAMALGQVLTLEQGKPIKAAIGEAYAAAYFFRETAKLDLPERVIADDENRKVIELRRPLGVVAAILPWNFPLSLIGFKLPPALLAGNTVVMKPAPTTPLSTLMVARIMADKLPAGVVNVITDANDLGGALAGHRDVAKVSFTGSTATGRKVYAGAAETMKRLTLELGGNDPAIVLDDVDVKAVAPALFANAFANSGQVCIAIKRLYAHESVYDALCDELVALADAAVVGDGMAEGTQFGPLQNRAQYEKVNAIIEGARKDGTVIAGGERSNMPGFFIRPTIVRDIDDGTQLVDEEQFGPVLPVIRYTDVNDAIVRANATPFGLGASVWSADLVRAQAIAEQIDSGTVWVNKHRDLAADVPFGGSRQSGIGTEMGMEGLLEFTQRRIVNMNKAT